MHYIIVYASNIILPIHITIYNNAILTIINGIIVYVYIHNDIYDSIIYHIKGNLGVVKFWRNSQKCANFLLAN